MRRIVVANQKGGCGKTTTVVNTAAALGETGKRVLVIDMDPMRTASKNFNFMDNDGGVHHVARVLLEEGDLLPLVQDTSVPGVQIIQSSWHLSSLVSALQSRNHQAPQLALRESMAKLPENWDYILIDSHPSLDMLTAMALNACSEVILAVQPATYDMDGIPAFVEMIQGVRKFTNPTLQLGGVVLCRANLRTIDGKACLETLDKYFPGFLFSTHIRESVSLRSAASFRQSVFQFDPRSTGAKDYRALAVEIDTRGTNNG